MIWPREFDTNLSKMLLTCPSTSISSLCGLCSSIITSHYILHYFLWLRLTGLTRWQQERRSEALVSSSQVTSCSSCTFDQDVIWVNHTIRFPPCVLWLIHLFSSCLKHWHSRAFSHCHWAVFHWGQFIDQISAYSGQSISSGCEGFLLISVSLEMKKK